MGTLRFSSLLLAVGLGGVLFLQSCRNNNPSKTKTLQTKTLYSNKKVKRMTPLEVGFAISLGRITKDTLVLAKSLGIDHIEISGLGMFVDKDLSFKKTDQEIIEKLNQVKKAADSAGINIWSIHMPFGPQIDLSLIDQTQRKQVVAMHQKLLQHLSILEPEMVLFHPSYYLQLGERAHRTAQLIASAITLDKDVQRIGASMVIENMLGSALLVDQQRERPLLRSVEECVAIFSKLPESIGLAVDTNHILHAENLILALGTRLKTLHIADGTGEAENHWFPCDYKGENNWDKVLAALSEVNYQGPFMYESSAPGLKAYKLCYQELHDHYVNHEDL
ncbi:sugar phosphate isomerase/epimerase family protein [Galbibacter sp.]|uniref:sugar phosphate isomerase/epimerase family protein n=1 Tax=Galbibacter sp. TaxID=2918471 RepID=UPI002CD95C93|nr:TIM barrel protein [Galbibacter sp.]HLV63831.1 TIM barrel protein [Galbibacter sp.]